MCGVSDGCRYWGGGGGGGGGGMGVSLYSGGGGVPRALVCPGVEEMVTVMNYLVRVSEARQVLP